MLKLEASHSDVQSSHEQTLHVLSPKLVNKQIRSLLELGQNLTKQLLTTQKTCLRCSLREMSTNVACNEAVYEMQEELIERV